MHRRLTKQIDFIANVRWETGWNYSAMKEGKVSRVCMHCRGVPLFLSSTLRPFFLVSILSVAFLFYFFVFFCICYWHMEKADLEKNVDQYFEKIRVWIWFTKCEMSRVKTFSNIQENWRDVQLFQAFLEHMKEHTGSTSANQLIAMTTSYHLFIGISWIVNDHFDSQFYCYNKYVYLDRKWTYRIDELQCLLSAVKLITKFESMPYLNSLLKRFVISDLTRKLEKLKILQWGFNILNVREPTFLNVTVWHALNVTMAKTETYLVAHFPLWK